MDYDWAVNKTKLAHATNWVRAQSQLPESGVKFDEATIKARYVKIAGLLSDDAVESVKENRSIPEAIKDKVLSKLPKKKK